MFLCLKVGTVIACGLGLDGQVVTTTERSPLSPFGDDAGLRGAALTVIEHTLKPDATDAFVTESAAA